MELKELFTSNKSLIEVSADIEFLFLLKAWKVLSDRNELDSDVNFNTIYNQAIDLKEIHNVFKQLSKNINVFSIFMAFYKDSPLNYNMEEVIKYLNIVANNHLSFSVIDAFEELNIKSRTHIPQQLVELGYKLIGNDSNELYFPFSQTFSIFSITDKKVYYEDAFDMKLVTSYRTPLILEMIKIIEKKDIEFPMSKIVLDVNKSPFSNPTFVNPDAPHLLKEFDSVLSFPPFGLRGELDTSKDKFHRFQFQRGTVLDIAYFEHVLAQTKSKAVVLMPVGLTYRSGAEEEFRKYLIEKNYVEAIIQLPPNLHNATSIETTFFVVNKHKDDDKVLFLNLKDESFIKRDGRKLVFKSLDEILDIYENKKEIENISCQISNEEIANNNYSFAIDRYVIAQEAKKLQKVLEQFELVNLEDIADIRRSQLFKDEGEGKEVYEISPSDFSKAGYTIECGKVKQIGSQYRRLQTYKLEPYDVLLSTKGTIGKVAIIGDISDEMIASQAIQVIRLHDKDKKDKAIALYMFLKSILGQTILSTLQSGVAMPQIATAEVKKLSIPLLSKEQEKRLISSFIDESKMYNEIEKINENIRSIHSNFLGDK